MAGREVAYSADGVVMLLAHLGARMREKKPRLPGGLTIKGLLSEARIEAAAAAVDEKKAAAPAEQELTVQALTRNGQIVMATRGEELVRVRVRESRHFVAGMKMTCRHLQADLWELVGRCPRFRGRW
jgi:DNA-directed RNA polymerase beta subunit